MPPIAALVRQSHTLPQIDKEHVQGDFPLPSELLQPAHDKQHINRVPCGAEATLFLQEKSLGLAVVTEAGRDDFQQNVSCVGNKRDPSVVQSVEINLVLPFVKDLDDSHISMAGGLLVSPKH